MIWHHSTLGKMIPLFIKDLLFLCLLISNKLNIPLKEQTITREALYLADEVFFTGTAAEITPIISIDRITIGNCSRGSVTRMLQKEFFGLFTLETADEHGWLEDVDKKNN